MIGAIILTFVTTTLFMLVLFLLDGYKKQVRHYNYILKENDGLRRQISDFQYNDRCRMEQTAYDKGLYDGRATDTFYRQCLKKLKNNEQMNIILNGEDEESIK